VKTSSRKRQISQKSAADKTLSKSKLEARSDDGTEYKQVSERMRISEIRYRRLFEAAHDGVLILDAVSRKITDANPFMTDLLGYTRDQLLGKELWEIGLLKDERSSHAAFRELQGKGEIRYEDLPLQSKSGAKREVEVVANRYEEDGKQVVQCNIRDITERKRVEEALRRSEARSRELFETAEVARVSAQEARARAEAATRAKDDFLAALSHELRTPLTPALLLASSMADDATLPTRVREDIDVIAKSIALQAQLIDDLLDVTRISGGKLRLDLRPIDAHAALRRALEIVRAETQERKIKVSFDLAATHNCIIADAVRVQQVFWNVVKNAVRFTPPGGAIAVRTRNPPSKEGTLVVEIADNGIGIEPEMIDKVFDAFAQEEHGAHRFGGVGLGLAITRHLVQLQNGQISVESAGRNRGATFNVELPLAASELCAEDEPAAVPSVAASAKTCRILLVEDHEQTRSTLARLLERRGHNVVGAATVAAAREIAATRGPFDLVISDLGLPDGDGHMLMTELRDAYRLPGIALSGYGMNQDLERSRQGGFLTHLTKPVDVHALQVAIAAVCEANPVLPRGTSTAGHR
jgi:PAS domain S-box-containing protein